MIYLLAQSVFMRKRQVKKNKEETELKPEKTNFYM